MSEKVKVMGLPLDMELPLSMYRAMRGDVALCDWMEWAQVRDWVVRHGLGRIDGRWLERTDPSVRIMSQAEYDRMAKVDDLSDIL